jgi:nitrite reductase/ring-hydroxylating ferredoxin subunit
MARRLPHDASDSDDVWSAPLDAIPPGGSAKFAIRWRGRPAEGFVVNVDGQYSAHVNYCAHAGTPLDWWPNEFLSEDGRYLVCGTHGSRYEPASGKCAGGPCAGGSLVPLQARIAGGRIHVVAATDQSPDE